MKKINAEQCRRKVGKALSQYVKYWQQGGFNKETAQEFVLCFCGGYLNNSVTEMLSKKSKFNACNQPTAPAQ